MKKRLTKYLEQQLRSIDYLLKKPADTYKPSTFHKLRLGIKKLYSLLDLLAFSYKDFERDEILKSFKPIFKQAGKIREFQVEETKLKKYFKDNLLEAYKNILKKDINKKKKKFFSTLKANRVKLVKETNRLLLPYLQKITQQKVTNYFRAIQDKLELETGQGLHQNNNIHKVRKLLKNFQYIREGSGVKAPGNRMVRNNLLADLLGKWHDSSVIVRHLEKELSDKRIKLKERHQLKNIQEKFVSREERLLGDIRGKLANSKSNSLKYEA